MISRLTLHRYLAVLLLPVLAACATSGLGNLQPPHVTLSNIAPADNMTFFEQRYHVTLRVQNPNNTDLPVDGLNYNVTLNGKEFARGVSQDDVTIPALGEGLVHVTVTSSPFDWVRQIDQLNRNPDLRPSYKVDGSLYLKGLGNRRLPFSQSGTFVPEG